MLGRVGLQKEERLEATNNPAIKCGHCYSLQVKRVCHHCGCYLCEKCEPLLIRWLRWSGLYIYLFKDHQFHNLRSVDAEFRTSTHCKACIHYTETLYSGLILIMIGFGLTGTFGLWLWRYPNSLVAGFVIMIFVLVGVLIVIRERVYRYLLADRADVQILIPVIYTVELTETIAADFCLTDFDMIVEQKSGIEINPDACGGMLSVALAPSPGYLGLHLAHPDQHHRFEAGFLGFDHREKVSFGSSEPLLKFNDEVVGYVEMLNHQGKLSLRGTLPSNIFTQLRLTYTPLKIEHPYEILEKAMSVGPHHDPEFPVWIMPDLSLARRRLTISIYIWPKITGKLKLETLSVKLPEDIVKHGVEIEGFLSTTANYIYWSNPHLQPGINRFSVKLKAPLPRGLPIKGEYKISIEEFLVSGLEVKPQGHLWFANGEPIWRDSKTETKPRLDKVIKKTIFSGEFALDSSVFKVQQEFTVSVKGVQPGCRPDHLAVARISQALTSRQVEIKRIEETPARIGDFRDGARLWDHYWEIQGRYYLEAKLQFVEVHVIVFGQENQAILLGMPQPSPTVNGDDLWDDRETSPSSDYTQEFIFWQLHLRGEIPIDDSDESDDDVIGENGNTGKYTLTKELKDLCKVLERQITDQLANLDGDLKN